LFTIEDRHWVFDGPITSGYRTDAMRIDTGGVSICRPVHCLTLLEQDFESALAAIPSGYYGEGVYEGLRYGVTVRKSRDGKRTNPFPRALAGGDAVCFKPLPTEVGRGLFACLRNASREGSSPPRLRA
jgi:hypothetical protein